jgi:hypothetical protein
MKDAPPGFALDRLHAALLESWGIRARELEYLPVGFGAHHWRAIELSKRAYFLALHDLELSDGEWPWREMVGNLRFSSHVDEACGPQGGNRTCASG